MTSKNRKRAEMLTGACLLAGAGAAVLSDFTLRQAFERDKDVFHSKAQREKYQKEQARRQKEADARILADGGERLHMQSEDGLRLEAIFYPAREETDRYIVCCHGYKGSYYGDFGDKIPFLHEQGFHLLLIEERASGDSEGRYITLGCYESRDIAGWCRLLKDRFGQEIRLWLYGVSMGSASVLMLSDAEEFSGNLCGIIADCGYADAEGQIKNGMHFMHMPVFPLYQIALPQMRRILRYDPSWVRPIDHVKKALYPIFFVHGEADDFVPLENVYRLYEACASEKDLLTVPGAGHTKAYQCGREEYEKKLKAFWAKTSA